MSDSAPTPSTPTSQSLAASKCVPCEGGVPKLTPDQAASFARATPEWTVESDANQIRRKLNCKTFVKAVKRVNQIAEIAEEQQHHPDLHLTGYRHLEIVLTTHAIGGLSENDFILAAQIDRMLDEQ
ncbi:4a-hydroxytetrahydrobiopterin dehydratase [Rhodopirellula sp. JC639]|uniref:4a-hydroxytetrahydrobiopterin dehydratase n=1 Tax=Stieleria mannarensis TaxID=2755585 RepID=UPI0016036150|nr:4a-hydroxytetrahydrobiopterin dehydratase [Rhodopirellula sp. JC639]